MADRYDGDTRDTSRDNQSKDFEVSNSEGGLFGDYEPQKRENPYKKKEKPYKRESRRAKKEKQASAVKYDWEISTEDDADRDRYDKSNGGLFDSSHEESEGSVSESRNPAGNFIFTHVKLITFLVCLFVFLAVFGPMSVFRIIELADEKKEAEYAAEYTITPEQFYALATKPGTLGFKDFAPYYYIDESTEGYVIWEVPVGENYTVWIWGGSVNNKPEKIILYDTATGDQYDVKKDDVSFILTD